MLAAGGAPQPATVLDAAGGEISHRLPHLLPDGRTVLYTSLRWTTEQQTWTHARIYAWRPGEKAGTLLVEGGSDGRWAPPGLLLFAKEGALRAAPFDSRALKLVGPPALVLEGVRHAVRAISAAADSGAAQVSLTDGGLLAWAPGSVDPPYPVRSVWIDDAGKETELRGAEDGEPILSRRISPDGQRVLLTFGYPGRQAEVLDLVRGTRRQATFEANPSWAIWGPGPDEITFTSDHEGPVALYTRRIDADPEELTTLWRPPDGFDAPLGSWSRDGKVLAFVRHSLATEFDIWLLEQGKQPRPFVASRRDEMHPDVSPDGQWLLYTSNEAGWKVFARALSGEGGALQVSAGGAYEPRWSRDGNEVYYWHPVKDKPRVRALFRVRVTKANGSLTFGAPEQLFEGSFGGSDPGHSWDVGPDGRFLVAKRAEEVDLRAFWDKKLPNRIVVDTGGVAHQLADSRPGP